MRPSAGVDSFSMAETPPAAGARASLFAADERGPGRPRRLPFAALLIPPRLKLKKRMLENLEGTYNRHRRVLFPDLSDFSEALRLGWQDVRSELAETGDDLED